MTHRVIREGRVGSSVTILFAFSPQVFNSVREVVLLRVAREKRPGSCPHTHCDDVVVA